ncbi:hypothetical protein LX15_001633 [Streptoalloteichus tenebrarius]|uniref:Uncharacterized protein n=1 Tax=Streptoalloteichus tenebrarius (strain ATCC 17920 / DSM 40477 / JCM 4838 / CBS 697.72 / NBRC 16177 / NCIMB 11028 / NRRL B-12390 / A12253. 1 / ISP 5477) TaxID=1933 RepID=A0ABT1HR00_STRSD|nr:hypothetical protein [Streptoalloteichus tenebrarius]MCP2257946.1 hypothetical protein [Streptoalloteichus tenebrarius]BFF01609.1 hypothetical protein GCM10020241_32840 [Streptoalloteichus tenebrarius]
MHADADNQANNADKSVFKGGRRLRTVQQMYEAGRNYAAIVLIAWLHQHLHSRFGPSGTLRSLAERAITLGLHGKLGMPSDIGSAHPDERSRHIKGAVKRISAQLGSDRHPCGPDWHYVEVIVRCCCDEGVDSELEVLKGLWRQARDGGSRSDTQDGESPTPPLDDDRLEAATELVVVKLRAELERSQADNVLYKGNLDSMIRAARVLAEERDLARRAWEDARRNEQRVVLQKEALMGMVEYEISRNASVQRWADEFVPFIAMSLAVAGREARHTGVAIQLTDPVQAVAERVLGEGTEISQLSDLLLKVSQHLRGLRVTASPERRALALYLFICLFKHDPFTSYARLAEKVGAPVEAIRSTLNAGLVQAPLVVAIAEAVGADRGWVSRLLQRAGVTDVLWPFTCQAPGYHRLEGCGS